MQSISRLSDLGLLLASTSIGIYGYENGGICNTTGWAGFFVGDVHVGGCLSATMKEFRIDHPMDPENRYLVHSSVESNERINIYKGHISTGARGEAWVDLPEYFEALNTDVEYNLTVIGQFAQVMVAKRIENGRFLIRTDKPNVEVSWQVYGVRRDPVAKAYPMIVEPMKSEQDRGKYLNPELYGMPKEYGIGYFDPNEVGKP